ncbi:hypothetical protein [Escherichia phage UB]|uniref:Uncharacterized protein n=1 Tax=Escherichia phage UB TaxID=2268588 RepID=A0A2Z5HAI4_9CAUD|nr:hypothetical protein [Escherichia phage UB]
MANHDDLIRAVVNLAADKKSFDSIYNTAYSDSVLACTQDQKDELIATYHEAWKYYRQWEKEESESTINGINNLI